MKKEVKKKNYPVLDFIESKVPYKKKKKRKNKSFYSPHSKY